MCLLVVAFGVDSNYPLIVAGNRDEFHARPSAEAGWWPDDPDILGGRDLQAGGTWLALHRRGRFSAVTNYHDAQPRNTELRSRGHLVTDFLHSTLEPLSYLGTIDGALYAGFNLFVSDGRSLAYCSNRGVAPTQLSAGIYGLSNATLDTPWSKVERSKQRLRGLIETTAVSATGLLDLLGDRTKGPAEEADSDRLPFPKAHAITAPFIVLPDYGTRCSTVVRADSRGHWELLERRFAASGEPTGESRYLIDSRVHRE